MKKTVVILLTILMLFSLFQGVLRENVVKGADYSPQDFVGYWINDDTATSGITKIFISISGDDFQVHAYGRCSPTDCDWGVSTTTTSDADDGELGLNWGFSIQHNLAIKLAEKNHLEVVTKTHFADNSGRQDYTIIDHFTKANVGEDFDKVLLGLFKNVQKLTFTGAPGIIAVTSQAFPLLISSNDSTPSNQIAIAGSTYGNGFVLGFCHDSFFSDSNFDYFDNKTFASNILSYATKKKILISVSHNEYFNQSNANKFSNYAKSLGFEVQFLNGQISTDALNNAGILISGSAWGDINDSEILAIKNFVNKGGVLLLGAVGWSWVSYHPEKTLDDLPANKIGKEFGIKWVDGVVKEVKDFIYNDATVFTILYPESLFSVKRSSLYSAQSIGSRNGIEGGPVYSIAIDHLNTEIIYAGTDYGVFNSLNGGESWTQTGLTNKTYSLAIDPHNTQVIYAGTAEGLFKSTDGGINWVRIFINSWRCYKVIVNPMNSQVIFLRTGNGSFKSNDGGITWDTIIKMGYFAYDPLDSNIIYAHTGEGVCKSTDGGNNWVDINNGLPKVMSYKYFSYLSFAIDPSNTQVIYIGTDITFPPSLDHGIFKSANGGKSWTKINNGLKTSWGDVALRIQDIVIDPKNTQTIYIATETASLGGTLHDDGVYKSTNGGNSWTQINSGLFNTQVKCLAIDPKNTQLIYAGTYGGIFKSTDGGLTWQGMNKGLCATDAKFLAMDYNNNEIIYAGTPYNGIFKSTDGGLTWREKNNGLTDWHTIELAVDAKNTEVVYIGTREGLFKSTNGGESWFKIFSKPTWLGTFTIDPKNPQTIYAAVEGESFDDFILFKSTDGGLSWNAIPPQVLYINDIIIDPGNPQVVYIATFDGIYKSTNAGLNWSLINNGLTDDSVIDIALDPINSQIIYAVTLHKRIFKSKDGGMNWIEIRDMGQLGISGIELKITDIVYEVISNNLFRVPFAAVNIRDSQIFFVGATKYLLSRVFNVTSISEYGGTVSPSGIVTINTGEPQTFTFTPNTGYKIKDVKVDGISVGAVSTYTFNNITSDHTIEAIFELLTYSISASAGSGGSISPSGTITVNYDDSKTFTITPNKDYKIKDVLVDGASIGATSSYTFTNVTSNHTISVTFEKQITQTVIILQIGNTTFTVNGSQRNLDSPPVIKNNRTLLPIRAVVEALGGTVGWDESTKKVTVSLGSTTIELWIGKSIAKVNGIDTPIDSANSKVVPEIINSRTMLPLRFVAEGLGAQVEWDGTTRTVTITYQS